ncbi:site-specific DNA-methyltransferase [Facklamia sp. P12932]|uniref:site-specific DNA-methyltransferase n=1 Tax=Facklamia sp. P12932 TaxID=3421947 RepID=UPI003D168164
MSNLSQKKRRKMLDYINQLKEIHSDDESIIALNNIENALTEKKYGLVWEEHSEKVDEMLEHNIPVFTEVDDRKIEFKPNEGVNFLLEGDNLHSLNLLEKTHKGKIDVIYIDPPYNTKNEGFMYNDRIVNNEDGYRHSKWLSFMYERLVISKELLNEKGIIFVSIDDNELFQLKNLCDEIFGEENFVNNIAVKTSEVSGVKMAHVTKRLVKMTENILMYKNGLLEIQPIKIPKQKWDNEYNKVLINFTKKDKEYVDYIIENSDNFSQEDYEKHIIKIDELLSNCKVDSVSKVSKSEGVDKKDLNKWKYKNSYRIFRTAASSSVFRLVEEKKKNNKNLFFSVISSRDKKLYLAKTDYRKTSKSPRVQMLFAEDYLEEYIGDLWTDISTTGLEVEGGVSFKNGKKPLELIKRVIKLNKNKDSRVLDFFAGSGTTGHAVMELNKEDGGNRKYILCTNNENKIAEEITYKRLKNIQEELPHNLKYFKTDFIKRFGDEEEILSERLLSHIKEMVELENMCEIDGKNRVLILSQAELEEWFNGEITEKSKVYLPSYILLSREIEVESEKKGIEFIDVPDYYFLDELREVNEL